VGVEQHDVTTGQLSQHQQGARDLALGVERASEALGEAVGELERKVAHERGV
jgi:hypothetical protein